MAKTTSESNQRKRIFLRPKGRKKESYSKSKNTTENESLFHKYIFSLEKIISTYGIIFVPLTLTFVGLTIILSIQAIHHDRLLHVPDFSKSASGIKQGDVYILEGQSLSDSSSFSNAGYLARLSISVNQILLGKIEWKVDTTFIVKSIDKSRNDSTLRGIVALELFSKNLVKLNDSTFIDSSATQIDTVRISSIDTTNTLNPGLFNPRSGLEAFSPLYRALESAGVALTLLGCLSFFLALNRVIKIFNFLIENGSKILAESAQSIAITSNGKVNFEQALSLTKNFSNTATALSVAIAIFVVVNIDTRIISGDTTELKQEAEKISKSLENLNELKTGIKVDSLSFDSSFKTSHNRLKIDTEFARNDVEGSTLEANVKVTNLNSALSNISQQIEKSMAQNDSTISRSLGNFATKLINELALERTAQQLAHKEMQELVKQGNANQVAMSIFEATQNYLTEEYESRSFMQKFLWLSERSRRQMEESKLQLLQTMLKNEGFEIAENSDGVLRILPRSN